MAVSCVVCGPPSQAQTQASAPALLFIADAKFAQMIQD
jgi:hypothetical protein